MSAILKKIQYNVNKYQTSPLSEQQLRASAQSFEKEGVKK